MSAALARIRAALPADARAIARVYIETWRAAYPGMLPDKVLLDMTPARQEAVWRQGLERPGRKQHAFVAEASGGAVVGFVTSGPARPRIEGYRGEVYTLYVDLDHQGLGLGRALLAEGFRALLASRLEPAVIWVLAENPARFFYEAMGGSAIARRRDRLGGEAHEEVGYGWPALAAAIAPGGPCSSP